MSVLCWLNHMPPMACSSKEYVPCEQPAQEMGCSLSKITFPSQSSQHPITGLPPTQKPILPTPLSHPPVDSSIHSSIHPSSLHPPTHTYTPPIHLFLQTPLFISLQSSTHYLHSINPPSHLHPPIHPLVYLSNFNSHQSTIYTFSH